MHIQKVLPQIFLITLALIAAACTAGRPGQAPVPDNYAEEIDAWKAARVASLTEPDGWMRLAGMFFLEEGEHTFGSSPDADVSLPDSTLPAIAGTFHLANGQVEMHVHNNIPVMHEGSPVTNMLLYDGENTPRATFNQLEWHVIVREDLTAIRLYNKENEKVDRFTGFPHYQINAEWRREARFVPSPEGATISIANVLGQIVDTPSPGKLEFTIGDTLYSLDALEGSTRLFIILGDATNGNETYPAGRYMYVDYPEHPDDFTILDFNKAYNPPCAYNPFTTCQLPPAQNRLSVAITAGEKTPVDWEGL